MLSSTIAFGREETYGVAPDEMTVLGEDVVLTIGDLKKQYGALGSYLHTPTLAKIDDPAAHDPAKLRKRIEASIQILGKVLASPIWNFTVGQCSEAACLRCGEMVRKRLQKDNKPVLATCLKCHAEYRVQATGDKVEFIAYRQEVRCRTKGCTATTTLWKDEVKEGHQWTCGACGKTYHLGFQIFESEKVS